VDSLLAYVYSPPMDHASLSPAFTIGIALAIILFEGGLNLEISRLRGNFANFPGGVF